MESVSNKLEENKILLNKDNKLPSGTFVNYYNNFKEKISDLTAREFDDDVDSDEYKALNNLMDNIIKRLSKEKAPAKEKPAKKAPAKKAPAKKAPAKKSEWLEHVEKVQKLFPKYNYSYILTLAPATYLKSTDEKRKKAMGNIVFGNIEFADTNTKSNAELPSKKELNEFLSQAEKMLKKPAKEQAPVPPPYKDIVKEAPAKKKKDIVKEEPAKNKKFSADCSNALTQAKKIIKFYTENDGKFNKDKYLIKNKKELLEKVNTIKKIMNDECF